MAGVWQVTFFSYEVVSDAGAATDSTSFFFCIQG
jgi:hypothetical protein